MCKKVRYSPILIEILMPLLTFIVEGWKVDSCLLWEVTGGRGRACVFRGNKSELVFLWDFQHLFVLVWTEMHVVFVCVCVCVCVCLLAGWDVLHLIPSGGWSPLCIHLHFNPCSCSLIGSFFASADWPVQSINSMIVVQMYVNKKISPPCWNVKSVFMWIIVQRRRISLSSDLDIVFTELQVVFVIELLLFCSAIFSQPRLQWVYKLIFTPLVWWISSCMDVDQQNKMADIEQVCCLFNSQALKTCKPTGTVDVLGIYNRLNLLVTLSKGDVTSATFRQLSTTPIKKLIYLQ